MRSVLTILFIATVLLPAAAQINLDSLDHANAKLVNPSGSKYLTRAIVSKTDSSIQLFANMRKDHRFFGYEKPALLSRRLILFSIFTTDVEGNPFGCPLGAYYGTDGMGEDAALKFLKKEGSFIKAEFIQKAGRSQQIYFPAKWFEFEK